MEVLTYNYALHHLAEVMDKVNEDRAHVLITRHSGKPVVMLSLDEFNALDETAYLLRNPANAQRLMASVKQLT